MQFFQPQAWRHESTDAQRKAVNEGNSLGPEWVYFSDIRKTSLGSSLN